MTHTSKIGSIFVIAFLNSHEYYDDVFTCNYSCRYDRTQSYSSCRPCSVVANGESAEASVSVVNSNDQKVGFFSRIDVQVLIKLRSNAGKLLRIKHSMFALDSKQKITLDSRSAHFLSPSFGYRPNSWTNSFRNTQKVDHSNGSSDFPLQCSYKLQFNVISISDLAFDKISKLPEEQQMEEMTNVVRMDWNL